MGQCQPLSIPSTFSLGDEEEFSVAATPPTNTFFACHDITLPTKRNQQQRQQQQRSNKKRITTPTTTTTSTTTTSSSINFNTNNRRNFLKLHRPDISQRNMIEPDEVKKVLMSQADELLKRRGLLMMGEQESTSLLQLHQLQDIGYSRGVVDDVDTRTEAGAVSMVSGYTTASHSTIMAGNGGKNSKYHHYNRKQHSLPKRKLVGNGGGVANHRGSIGGLNSVPEDNGIQSLDAVHEIGSQEHLTAARTKLQHGSSSSGANNQRNLQLVERLVNQHHQQRSSIDARRDHYMSVLRLKMKARLGYFYSQRYLMMFPNGPRPDGIHTTTKKKHDIPDLASDSSSASSSSSENSQFIDYGALPPATPIKCSVTDESFLDLAITGSLGLVPRKGNSLPHGYSYQSKNSMIHTNLKSPEHYIVLINRRSGIPLAVCAMKAASGFPVVRIYATRPRVYAQRPAATTQQLGLDWADDLPLFTWAEVVSEGDFPDQMKFSIFMANGSEGRFSSQASYEATFDGNVEQPVIKMVGKTDMERSFSGCALISIRVDDDSSHNNTRNRSNDNLGLNFHIDLAKGIDPALLICFTAIADEVIEKSMRIQCKEQAKRRIRKAAISLSKKRMEAIEW
jgi:hypothetical protein